MLTSMMRTLYRQLPIAPQTGVEATFMLQSPILLFFFLID
jgi:hypothetical protein